ncbi:MAG: phosphoribosylamine--glycine ligase [Planctomycetes bacterium]|nr:phosphoribosylamine--glycine ligase [Planctomycetota bacterium]
MKILVVGGGGREHALCWKIAKSPKVKHLFCAPGNAGIAQVAQCVPISARDIAQIADFAVREKIDLVVVGPEEPLCAGLADLLQKREIRCFGPSAAAAEIEGSKVFCKDLLRRHRVPTPGFQTFNDTNQAIAFLEAQDEFPIVVKASGLAAGKGVTICNDRNEAKLLVKKMLELRSLGDAGSQIVIEEFVKGSEISVLALTDGNAILPLEPARDHKRLKDGDAGPNTGGMGVICPVPTPHRFRLQIEQQILLPVVHAMNRENRKFKGVLYAGLILSPKGPMVLEFNCRFGDPEAQGILLRFADDIVPYLEAVADGTLEKCEGPRFDPRVSVTVVAASPGYPDNPETGLPIAGLQSIDEDDTLRVFHAGTKLSEGKFVTTGGRVLAVSALGADLMEARARAYDAMDAIKFVGKQIRRDIGIRELADAT